MPAWPGTGAFACPNFVLTNSWRPRPRAGRSSAIIHLLQREDQRDSVDRLLEDLFDGRAE